MSEGERFFRGSDLSPKSSFDYNKAFGEMTTLEDKSHTDSKEEENPHTEDEPSVNNGEKLPSSTKEDNKPLSQDSERTKNIIVLYELLLSELGKNVSENEEDFLLKNIGRDLIYKEDIELQTQENKKRLVNHFRLTHGLPKMNEENDEAYKEIWKRQNGDLFGLDYNSLIKMLKNRPKQPFNTLNRFRESKSNDDLETNKKKSLFVDPIILNEELSDELKLERLDNIEKQLSRFVNQRLSVEWEDLSLKGEKDTFNKDELLDLKSGFKTSQFIDENGKARSFEEIIEGKKGTKALEELSKYYDLLGVTIVRYQEELNSISSKENKNIGPKLERIQQLMNKAISNYLDFQSIYMSIDADTNNDAEKQKKAEDLAVLQMIFSNEALQDQSLNGTNNEAGVTTDEKLLLGKNHIYNYKIDVYLARALNAGGLLSTLQQELCSRFSGKSNVCSSIVESIASQTRNIRAAAQERNKGVDLSTGLVAKAKDHSYDEFFGVDAFISNIGQAEVRDLPIYAVAEKLIESQRLIMNTKKHLLLSEVDKTNNSKQERNIADKLFEQQRTLCRRIDIMTDLTCNGVYNKDMFSLDGGLANKRNKYLEQLNDKDAMMSVHKLMNELGDLTAYDWREQTIIDNEGDNLSFEIGRMVQKVYELATSFEGENVLHKSFMQGMLDEWIETAYQEEKDRSDSLKYEDERASNFTKQLVKTALNCLNLGWQASIYLHGTTGSALPDPPVFHDESYENDAAVWLAKKFYYMAKKTVGGRLESSLYIDVESELIPSSLGSVEKKCGKSSEAYEKCNAYMQTIEHQIENLKKYSEALYPPENTDDAGNDLKQRPLLKTMMALEGRRSHWRMLPSLTDDQDYIKSQMKEFDAKFGITDIIDTDLPEYPAVVTNMLAIPTIAWLVTRIPPEEHKKILMEKELIDYYIHNGGIDKRASSKGKEQRKALYRILKKENFESLNKAFSQHFTKEKLEKVEKDAEEGFTPSNQYQHGLEAFMAINETVLTPINKLKNVRAEIAIKEVINSKFSQAMEMSLHAPEMKKILIAAICYYIEKILRNCINVENQVQWSVLRQEFVPNKFGTEYNNQYTEAVNAIRNALHSGMKGLYLDRIDAIVETVLKKKCRRAPMKLKPSGEYADNGDPRAISALIYNMWKLINYPEETRYATKDSGGNTILVYNGRKFTTDNVPTEVMQELGVLRHDVLQVDPNNVYKGKTDTDVK